MKLVSKYVIILLATSLFVSCSESRKKAKEKLKELNEQAEQLNSVLDEGIKKIEALDSVIGAEAEQLKEIDSLIEKTSANIDSIATEKVEAWKNIAN